MFKINDTAPCGLEAVSLLVVSLAIVGSGCGGPNESAQNAVPSEAGAETQQATNGSAGGAVEASTSMRFASMAAQAGVDFTYRNGQEADKYSILESLGGGIALFDYDNDGGLDLFAPGGGGFSADQSVLGCPAVLYRQTGDWQLDAVTQNAGVEASPFYSHGVAVADFGNDGFQDVLVTGYGGLLLFRNEGDGTFTETASAAGLDDALWSSSAAWGDLNEDGVLDLYVTHYVNWSFENDPVCGGPQNGQREVCPPRSFEGLPDSLYFGNGDGTFRDSSDASGLRTDGKGLGVLIADLNVDGHVDVYVGNDTVANFLYQNDGAGKLTEVGLQSAASLSESGTPDGSMGVDMGDFNLDGLPDLWVANYERESFALYRNEGSGFFRHVSQATGVTAVGALVVGWGTAFADFDCDGDEDVIASNGHVIRHPDAAPLRQIPLLFENRIGDTGRIDRAFINVAGAAGEYFTQPHMGRGLAIGDIDNDGRLDVAISHTNEPIALLKNESLGTNNWLGLRLIGTTSSRDPVGARVTLIFDDGQQLTRQLKGGGSYASASNLRLHFGLGTAAAVLRVEIQWPSGIVQTLGDSGVNQYHDVVELEADSAIR